MSDIHAATAATDTDTDPSATETTTPTTAPATTPAPDPAADQQRATAEAERAAQLQAALDAVNKALNPDGQGGEQDPAALAAAVAERDKQLVDAAAQLRTAQVELAAYKAAGKQGARADRLLNSRSFLTAVAQLDPGSDTFTESLKSAITAAVDADPELYRAAAAAPARGGAEFNGAPSGERRPTTLHDAIAARLGG
ncbi:hypothetical protein ACH4UT_24050 [Streptomyces sp. NPDC020799]|uniref:hypothetical protein n=1 Tax=Streptomyces sp. NPDC020799 TaxID=3365091 RepID=UPI003789F0E9